MENEVRLLRPLGRRVVLGRVTVITSVYNAALTLTDCIESVLHQDYPDIEHVLIDGASSDRSIEILESYANRIVWKSEPDKGIYDAWNKGLGLATGEWIAFLGGDDLYLPGAIRTYMDFAKADKNLEFMSSRVRLLYPSGATREIGRPWSWPRFQSVMTTAHVGSLHNQALFEKYGLYDTAYRMVGDYELLLRAQGTLRTTFIPVVTAEMKVGGATDSFASLHEAERAKVMTGKRNAVVARFELIIADFRLFLRKAIINRLYGGRL